MRRDKRPAGKTRCSFAAISMVIAGAIASSACGGGSSDASGVVGRTEAGAATYGATLTWAQPNTNTDGSPLLDASGYRVDYGVSPTNLALSASVIGAANTSTTIGGLNPGTYYFAVVTLNSAGVASARSAIVSKTLP